MNPQQLQQQIALYYSKLPSDVQQVFSSMTWMGTLENISNKYSLNEDQKETLGTETTLVLLGIIDLDTYETTLGNELGMQVDQLYKMVAEINDSILKPIRPQLGETYDRHVESLVAEKYGGIENLDARFSKLPKEVQTAINESNYQQELYTIANGQKLSVDQMGILEESTNKVLLGITHPDKYEGELKERLGLPSDKVTELVNSVNEKVLRNIREILKSHWDGNNKDVTKSVEDEVPIPPYAKSPVIEEKLIAKDLPIQNPLSKVESGIYQKAGIEVVEEKKPEPQDDLAKSIIASKLSKMTMSKPITSDHSLPKVASQPTQAQAPVKEGTPAKPHDPYHEEI